MNTRIKELRKTLGLSQSEFAIKIGIGQTGISSIERGNSIVTDRTINQIVSTFGVDENWLRTGEGEPFPLPPEEDERLLQLLAELTDENTDPRKKRLIATFCQLIMDSSEEDLDALSRIFESLHSALADEKDEG